MLAESNDFGMLGNVNLWIRVSWHLYLNTLIHISHCFHHNLWQGEFTCIESDLMFLCVHCGMITGRFYLGGAAGAESCLHRALWGPWTQGLRRDFAATDPRVTTLDCPILAARTVQHNWPLLAFCPAAANSEKKDSIDMEDQCQGSRCFARICLVESNGCSSHPSRTREGARICCWSLCVIAMRLLQCFVKLRLALSVGTGFVSLENGLNGALAAAFAIPLTDSWLFNLSGFPITWSMSSIHADDFHSDFQHWRICRIYVESNGYTCSTDRDLHLQALVTTLHRGFLSWTAPRKQEDCRWRVQRLRHIPHCWCLLLILLPGFSRGKQSRTCNFSGGW